MALRQSLIELAALRQTSVGQHTKMEIMYQYLSDLRFRQRLEAIVAKAEQRTFVSSNSKPLGVVLALS
jgi:hypothetical protein